MKVAVYTIALNEAAHAERWASSAVDADYRIVADTGSTDGTVEKLRAAGVTVHQIAIKPWRFDDARNAALALIPADVDVCCSMDMDRFLMPGWREKLEATWRPETTALFNQVHYRNSVDDPTVLRSFPVKNFHSRSGYRFKRPVHEALFFSGHEVAHGTAEIVMGEVQDLTKGTRNQYLPLMELAHREDPDDAQICFWLGREYMYANRAADAVPLLERYLTLPTSTWGEERSEAMRYLAGMQPHRKIHWLDRAREEAGHRREIWLDLAEAYNVDGDWLNLFWACASGIEKTRRTNSYLDDGGCWGPRLYELGALAAWHVKATDLAAEWSARALELEPNSARLKANRDLFAGKSNATGGTANEPSGVGSASDWESKLREARCLKDLRDEVGFVNAAREAFQADPTRPEPLQDLADYFLSTGRGDRAAFFAEAMLAAAAMTPGWQSGVDSNFQVLQSFTIAANWTQDLERKERGRQVCDWLALTRDAPANVREAARWNSGWFAASLPSLAPSVRYQPLSIVAPEGFRSANLGICNYKERFILTVRAVNYDLVDGYHVKGDDPSYRSRMLLSTLDDEFNVERSIEVQMPENVPVHSTEALGFDDPRPFVWNDQLWCVSSSRQLNPEARPEMVLARIDLGAADRPALADWRIVPSGMPPRWEKNWMPQVVGDDLRLIYSTDPTRVLADDGSELVNHRSAIAAETFFGGSQLVSFDGGWLAIVHEFEWVDRKRRYFHRFVWFSDDMRLERLSRRFYLSGPGYEFVAGLARHPDGQQLIISFCRNDRDPFLAFIQASDVRRITVPPEDFERASAEAIELSAEAHRALLRGEGWLAGERLAQR